MFVRAGWLWQLMRKLDKIPTQIYKESQLPPHLNLNKYTNEKKYVLPFKTAKLSKNKTAKLSKNKKPNIFSLRLVQTCGIRCVKRSKIENSLTCHILQMY